MKGFNYAGILTGFLFFIEHAAICQEPFLEFDRNRNLIYEPDH